MMDKEPPILREEIGWVPGQRLSLFVPGGLLRYVGQAETILRYQRKGRGAERVPVGENCT
jgi:hypothetical protein